MSSTSNGLVRHRGMIGGVCATIAARFGISATLVRVLFLLACVPGGVPGIGTYLVLWLAFAILVPRA